MIDNPVQLRLEDLREQFSVLHQLCLQKSDEVPDLLPFALEDLLRSVSELDTRRRPRAAAQAATTNRNRLPKREQRLRTVLDRAPMMVRLLDSNMRPRWSNASWRGLRGRKREHARHEWMSDVHPDDRMRCAREWGQAAQLQRPFRIEYRLRRSNGRYAWVLELGTPRLTSTGALSGYLTTAVEITERRSTEKRLALQYEVARILTEASSFDTAASQVLNALCSHLDARMAALWLADDPMHPHYVVHAHGSDARISRGCELEMRREAESMGLHPLIHVPLRVHGEVRGTIAAYGEETHAGDEALGRALGSQIAQFLARLDAEANVRKLEAAPADSIAVYQQRLRSLAADLLVVEERERRRLASDLHDGLSQTITLARMKLSALRKRTEGAALASLGEIEQLVDSANRSARSLTFELSPPVLHDLGLEPALSWLVENIQARYGLSIKLEVEQAPEAVDEKIRVIFFRSIRELLINAAKHARARSVCVRLDSGDDVISVSVEDDGVGMTTKNGASCGSGLFSIRERLSHVGGSMCIDSAPGQGTKIQLRAPSACTSKAG